jgi:hypothetical protein
MCYKNAQVQNKLTIKWGTCHNGKWVVVSKINCYCNILSPKQFSNQNVDKVSTICVTIKGGWDPIGLLVPHLCNLYIMGAPMREDHVIDQCNLRNIGHKHLPSGALNLKTNNTIQ